MVASGMNSSAKTGRGKLALLCGLAMVFVAVCVRLVRSDPQTGLAASPPARPPVEQQVPKPAALPSGPLNVIAWPGAPARDPFRSAKVYPPQVARVEVAAPVSAPIDVVAQAREAIHLKGTVQGERSLAMVNGRVFRAGESVAGFRIVEITKRSITVERAGSRVVIEPD